MKIRLVFALDKTLGVTLVNSDLVMLFCRRKRTQAQFYLNFK